MKLVIVRHGDPDYEHDTLTETGRIEAMLTAERLKGHAFAACYVSPLGRAQDTAEYTLDACGMKAVTLPWLREFHAPILHPDTGDVRVPWADTSLANKELGWKAQVPIEETLKNAWRWQQRITK